MKTDTLHTFHIPVMGLAYTIDSPVKVARYGISSVVSIIEDSLVEKMREHYYKEIGEPYVAIRNDEADYRARRITDYLNLLNRIVTQQIESLRSEAFVPGSEICKYFEMLPQHAEARKLYDTMMSMPVGTERTFVELGLRQRIKAGGIDVNIMTKLDKNNRDAAGNVIADGSDAVAALRGYANSDLTDSSIVLSAGMNPRLFNYMEKVAAFEPDAQGRFSKKIVIKVSDYRSALVQGKMLAKKGIWVSEFRIESGLNCGGHAFASDGYLLGPILEEFKVRRAELNQTLLEIYQQAIIEKGKVAPEPARPILITVQGGIGTAREDSFLHRYYEVDSTGWGTPFLLVPEATTVDEETLQKLSQAREEDVVLSKNSPLGVRFHYLRGTSAEQEKHERIERGQPGSPCSEEFLVSNTEFGDDPICTASHKYQQRKINQLQTLNLAPEEYDRQVKDVLDKECLCVGLSNAAVIAYGLTPFRPKASVNICPGPNIAYFSEIVSLRRMVDHIYGRANVLANTNRPHMFLKELSLYVSYWTELLTETRGVWDARKKTYAGKFYENLLSGISYYRGISSHLADELTTWREQWDKGLNDAEAELKKLYLHYFEPAMQGA